MTRSSDQARRKDLRFDPPPTPGAAVGEVSEQEREAAADLIAAYRHGFFPMADPRTERMHWFNPDPRAILPLEEGPEGLHVPRSLARVIRRGRFEVTTDEAFADVIDGCAEPRPDREDTWIDDRIRFAYTALHRVGHAHSVEAWLRDEESGQRRLVGGLYGVTVGGLFAAESKFSRPEHGGTDASKVCLVALVHHLRRRGFRLLDVQFWNPHIHRFGVREIPRAAYRKLLERAVEAECDWLPFRPFEPF